MKLPKLPITAALLLFVAVIAILVAFSFFKKNKAGTPTQEITQEIVLSEQGFKPETVSVKKGTRVIWINNSTAQASINSDDHPSHTKFPVLNLGEFEPGSNLQLILDKPGTYSYHNHLNPEMTGTVIITE